MKSFSKTLAICTCLSVAGCDDPEQAGDPMVEDGPTGKADSTADGICIVDMDDALLRFTGESAQLMTESILQGPVFVEDDQYRFEILSTGTVNHESVTEKTGEITCSVDGSTCLVQGTEIRTQQDDEGGWFRPEEGWARLFGMQGFEWRQIVTGYFICDDTYEDISCDFELSDPPDCAGEDELPRGAEVDEPEPEPGSAALVDVGVGTVVELRGAFARQMRDIVLQGEVQVVTDLAEYWFEVESRGEEDDHGNVWTENTATITCSQVEDTCRIAAIDIREADEDSTFAPEEGFVRIYGLGTLESRVHAYEGPELFSCFDFRESYTCDFPVELD